MSDEITENVSREDLLRMAVDIVAAYVSQNNVTSAQIPDVISTVFGALETLSSDDTATRKESAKPAVPVRRSVTDDYIVCLEDGKKLKMLKRHLRTNYGMSPEEYRLKWNLPPDYPMVSPNYAKQRSEFAKKIGLGRKADGQDQVPEKPKSTRRGAK
ncbi:MAG: MucR family transcriptional regulator [Hyphomicrobiales bacterium]|nr:MucR family transcriptional regulator [Hyphomicrobiales bacterium]MCP5373495.1 MucR family transcriptional regulator [Hyphomicrobiales bacterium]